MYIHTELVKIWEKSDKIFFCRIERAPIPPVLPADDRKNISTISPIPPVLSADDRKNISKISPIYP